MSINLSEGLAAAAALCPDLASWWQNTTFRNPTLLDLQTELPTIMCQVANLNVLGFGMNRMIAEAAFCICPVGIVCCVLALIVLSNKECKDVTFVYHRAINICSIIWLLFAIENGTYTIFVQRGTRFYTWERFHNMFGNRLDNSISDFVELVVAWMSIERTSVYVPSIFPYINKKHVAYTVLVVLFTVALALVLPYAFEVAAYFDEGTQTYKTAYTPFGLSAGFKSYNIVYNTIVIVRLVLVLTGAIGTIIVLMLISRQKKRLAQSIGLKSHLSTTLIDQIKSNQMLCLLQLCESIPLAIKCILILMLQSLTLGFTFETFTVLRYVDAIALITKFKYTMGLSTARKILQLVVHSSHFVMYCCLSKRIRKLAKRMIRGIRVSVVSSGNRSS